MESKDTAWRVTKADLKKNEKYDQYQEMIEEMLQRTDTEYAPWTIVEATDSRYATVKGDGGRGEPGSGKRGV